MQSSKKGLIVMDIDDTMMSDSPYSIRPYLREFLQRVSNDYDLAIWTAASHSRVVTFLTILNQFVDWKFIWDIEACPKDSDHYGIKDLRTVCRAFGIAPEKMILIDDEPDQYDFNTPLGFRVIQAPIYTPIAEDHFFYDLLSRFSPSAASPFPISAAIPIPISAPSSVPSSAPAQSPRSKKKMNISLS